MAKLHQPDTVVLELTKFEAQVLVALLASVSGKGPVRDATDAVHAALVSYDDDKVKFVGHISAHKE